MDIALMLRKYLRHMETFGMFARVTDITPKTVDELKNGSSVKWIDKAQRKVTLP
jgi:hypothetical protein